MIRYGIPLVFLFLILVYGGIYLRGQLTALDSYALEYEGVQRTYRLAQPEDMDDAQTYPVAIVLHGVGGQGQGIANYTDFHEYGTDWIVAYPDGIERNWNDGRAEIQSVWETPPDDIGFLSALIAELETNLPVDTNKIYVIGTSNGGIMALKMGCERADSITGIGVVTASFPVDMECEPTEPLEVVIMNGTNDPLMPYEGGEIADERGTIVSTQDMIDFWADHNNCETSVTDVIDEDLNDNTRVDHLAYMGCDDGGALYVYYVAGGGHTWAGGNQYAPETVIGLTSKEIHASEVLIEHFGS